MDILIPILWFAALGGVLGLFLAIASRVFAVKKDDRVEKITDALPGANCGGCGFSGCGAYAEAIVAGEAKNGACAVGGSACAAAIAEIMGIEACEVMVMRARVLCAGTCDTASYKYIYEGASDCAAAVGLSGGDKFCRFGCVGHGSCVKVCAFDAITVKDGVAVIDPEKCTGCGTCVSVCPRHIISLVPTDATVVVDCRSLDDGKTTRTYCKVGCIGCRICEKNCPVSAIRVENNCAVIDYDLCTGCGLCAEKCPRKIIHLRAEGYPRSKNA
ncbi:MAG: RnfABCDGE type electron transport complex subunit B [Clostridia bacterium]|nr:RnfABCDGE type electron transport complex subunit B [Clostridia bacterium]